MRKTALLISLLVMMGATAAQASASESAAAQGSAAQGSAAQGFAAQGFAAQASAAPEAETESFTVEEEPETFFSEDFKYPVGWDYWHSLPDLLPCLGGTIGDVKEAFPEATEELVSHGILTLATENGAAQFFCDYDPEKSGDEQEIIQVTLNEEAEYQYRLRDIAVGENRSDSGYWLGADGYLEADTQAAGEDQEEGAYISTYVDPEDPVVFIVLYGRFSDVLGVSVREIREEDIDLYEKEWEEIFG